MSIEILFMPRQPNIQAPSSIRASFRTSQRSLPVDQYELEVAVTGPSLCSPAELYWSGYGLADCERPHTSEIPSPG